jgi:hypothetical protein
MKLQRLAMQYKGLHPRCGVPQQPYSSVTCPKESFNNRGEPCMQALRTGKVLAHRYLCQTFTDWSTLANLVNGHSYDSRLKPKPCVYHGKARVCSTFRVWQPDQRMGVHAVPSIFASQKGNNVTRNPASVLEQNAKIPKARISPVNLDI